MNVQCSSCNELFDAEPDLIGQTVECPLCGDPVEVNPQQRASRRSVVIAPTIAPLETSATEPPAPDPPQAQAQPQAQAETAAEAVAEVDPDYGAANADESRAYSRGTLMIGGGICLGVGLVAAMIISHFLLRPDSDAGSDAPDAATLEELNRVKGLLLEQDNEIEALQERLIDSERAGFAAEQAQAATAKASASDTQAGQGADGPTTLDRIEAVLGALGFQVPEEGDFYRGATKNREPLPRPFGAPKRASAGSTGHFVYDIRAGGSNQAPLRVIFERGRFLVFVPAEHNPGLPRDLLQRLGIGDDPDAVLAAAQRQWKILHDVRVFTSGKGTLLASDELPTIEASYEALFGITP